MNVGKDTKKSGQGTQENRQPTALQAGRDNDISEKIACAPLKGSGIRDTTGRHISKKVLNELTGHDLPARPSRFVRG